MSCTEEARGGGATGKIVRTGSPNLAISCLCKLGVRRTGESCVRASWEAVSCDTDNALSLRQPPSCRLPSDTGTSVRIVFHKGKKAGKHLNS